MDSCDGPDCNRQAIKKGYCNAHYSQFRLHGYTWRFGEKPHKQRRTCTFEGCEKFRSAFGLCASHSKQSRLGIELRPIREARPTAEEGYSWCSTCKQFRAVEDFVWDKTRDQPSRRCADCHATAQRKYNARPGQRLARRASRLRSKCKIEPDDYERRYGEQGGKCLICDTSIPYLLTDIEGENKDHAVDHDHTTGDVRGLLCSFCNRALGMMQDDPDRLEAAARYLRERSARSV
jgi:hypothetical protein